MPTFKNFYRTQLAAQKLSELPSYNLSMANMADKGDKGKKRKRNTDTSPKPSKKVAFEGFQNVKISFHGPGKWAPIIGMEARLINAKSRHFLGDMIC